MIEVGEYVRSWNGTIGKVSRIEEEKFLYDGKELICFIGSVLKHSHNIIDLIEPGDYVNGKKVNSVSQGYVYEEFDFDTATAICSEDKIKSIVTHEQFAQMEYKL